MKNLRKFAALIMITIVIFIISGCSLNSITLSTELIIDENFSGERIITMSFKDSLLSPKSFESMEISDFLFSNVPKVFEIQKKRNVNSTDFKFILKFSSIDDYRSKIKKLLNNDAEVSFFYSQDNLLTKGIKLFENFSSKDLLNFLKLKDKNLDTKILKNLRSSGTKIIFNGESHWTSNNIAFTDISFLPVEKLTIYTKNNLDNTYNREFKIRFRRSEREKIDSNFYEYMSYLTDEKAFSTGFTYSKDFEEYNLLYLNLDLNSLRDVTSKFLNLKRQTDTYYSIYNDKTTFIQKYSVFDETLDLSLFSSENKKINIEYFYECPNEIEDIDTYNNSNWENYQKNFKNRAYLVKSYSNIFKVRFFDKKSYTVDNLIFKLKHFNGNNFEKSVRFIYNKNNNESYEYLKNYLDFKNINDGKKFLDSEIDNICEINKTGFIEDIYKYYSHIFGNENYSTYTLNNYDFGIFDSVKIKDYISLLNNKNGKNNIPISYIISDESNSSQRSLKYNIGYKKITVPFSKDKANDTVFYLKNDNFIVTYKYNQKNKFKIIFGFFIILFILICVIFIIYMVNRRTKIKLEANNEKRN